MRASEEQAFRDYADARMPSLMRTALLLTGGDWHRAEDIVSAAALKLYVSWRRASRAQRAADSRGGYRDPSNVRRDLREARSPIGSETRQELGRGLRRVRRATGLAQEDVAKRSGWAQSRVSLVETARVRLDLVDAVALLDLARQAAEGSEADALAWITSHSLRKTTATILDDAGQSARQIAD